MREQLSDLLALETGEIQTDSRYSDLGCLSAQCLWEEMEGWGLDVNLEVHSVAPNADVVWLLRGVQYQPGSWFSVGVSSGKQLCR